MIKAVVVVSLSLSVANWLLFVAAAVVEELPRLRAALRGRPPRRRAAAGALAARARLDKLLTATGTLATSLRSAGPAATAAALSFACLLVAAVSAGVDKL